ncbi:MAG: 50S ribosomal protein L6 [Alphaproteobacteria bacterium]|nr:50S ribosomal protein L6 [Alphaproteobacteria bacterium]
MSRIGNKAIAIPTGVDVQISGQDLSVKGPKGTLKLKVSPEIEAKREQSKIVVLPRDESRRTRMVWGMQRTLINNLIGGVTQGYSESLIIEGVGFRAALQGKTLVLTVGFSHEVHFPIPPGIDIKVDNQTQLKISGLDRQLVGQTAAKIRAFRKPEPYKGKGIRYSDERVRRKEGKKK